jgi:hypothetical protein
LGIADEGRPQHQRHAAKKMSTDPQPAGRDEPRRHDPAESCADGKLENMAATAEARLASG